MIGAATATDTSDTEIDQEYEVQSDTEITLSELSSGPEVSVGSLNLFKDYTSVDLIVWSSVV